MAPPPLLSLPAATGILASAFRLWSNSFLADSHSHSNTKKARISASFLLVGVTELAPPPLLSLPAATGILRLPFVCGRTAFSLILILTPIPKKARISASFLLVGVTEFESATSTSRT